MNAPIPRVRLVTLGDNPFPDIPADRHDAAHELVTVTRQFADSDNAAEIAEFHNEHNLTQPFDAAMVRRLVAYALRADTEPREPGSRFDLHTIPELLARPYATWLVREIMPASGLAVVYGGPGSGKTFLMLDMAMAIARGIQWHGRRTKRGVCVYIAGEGAMRGRVAAYLKRNELIAEDVPDFYAIESAVNLLDAKADVLDLIDAIKAKVGDRPIRMIVIDTLARSMPGGNENASEDMGAVIGNAGKLSAAFACLLAFVHHSGKDDTKGSRGHSSLKGACDVEISVKRDGEIREAFAEKVRDGSDQASLLTFRLESVDLGPVSDFDPEAESWERITSCVVSTAEKPPPVRRGPTGSNQSAALVAIRQAILNGQTLLEAEAVRLVETSCALQRQRAYEAVKGLIKGGYIQHGPMGPIELLD
jgi:hypothetical protein